MRQPLDSQNSHQKCLSFGYLINEDDLKDYQRQRQCQTPLIPYPLPIILYPISHIQYLISHTSYPLSLIPYSLSLIEAGAELGNFTDIILGK